MRQHLGFRLLGAGGGDVVGGVVALQQLLALDVEGGLGVCQLVCGSLLVLAHGSLQAGHLHMR